MNRQCADRTCACACFNIMHSVINGEITVELAAVMSEKIFVKAGGHNKNFPVKIIFTGNRIAEMLPEE